MLVEMSEKKDLPSVSKAKWMSPKAGIVFVFFHNRIWTTIKKHPDRQTTKNNIRIIDYWFSWFGFATVDAYKIWFELEACGERVKIEMPEEIWEEVLKGEKLLCGTDRPMICIDLNVYKEEFVRILATARTMSGLREAIVPK